MSDKIFGTDGDTATMTSQFNACSFGKLTITNDYSVDISKKESAKGVVEVKINVDITTSNKGTIRNAVTQAVQAKLGRSLPGPWDHVMAAYALVNSWNSVYQKNYYKFPGVQTHEIGHNLNFAHSGGLNGATYTDHSCLMGNPLYSDDNAKMCYNPAKNFQIASEGAWYDGHTAVWNSGSTTPKLGSYKLVGIADYDNNPKNNPVVVKLESGTDTDAFIGYNRAYGVNADNKQGSNQVTIVESGQNGLGYSQSFLKAVLSEGQSYTFNNWQSSGKDLVVTVKAIVNTNPRTAEVELSFGNVAVTAQPSNAQTSQPSSKPTSLPTRKPSSSPSRMPTTPRPVTPAPTKACGDGICKAFETDQDCPADCVDLEFLTYMDNIGAKVANGTMFTVYTKRGSYQGFEDSDAGWDLIYDKNTLQNGKIVLTELSPFINGQKVNIPEGEEQSFYVYTPSNLVYRGESVNEGDVIPSKQPTPFPSTKAPVTENPTPFPSKQPVTLSPSRKPTFSPTTKQPTGAPSTLQPTTKSPTKSPVTPAPTSQPTTKSPTNTPVTPLPTSYPSNLPTPLPTTSCGDNVCEASENDTSCPSDCGNLALTTNVAGDRGAQGTMFSVEATRDVVVTSFDLYSGSSATAQVQVYTRAGSYKGYELIEDGWTLVFDKGVQQFGRSTLSGIGPLTSEVAIAAGSVQSFYIYNANTVMYTLGTTEGNRKAFDESLAFYEGVGITNKFSGNTADLYIPRVFSGVMRYRATSFTPPPSSMPNTVAPSTKSPSPAPITPAPVTPSPTTKKPTSKPVTPAPSTKQPTFKPTAPTCPNTICEPFETATTCSVDCLNVALTTAALGTSGAASAMFYVRAKRDVTITSLDFFGSTAKTALVQIYTRSGKYNGYEVKRDGWEVIFDKSVVQGKKTLTSLGALSQPVYIPAGSYQSFVVYTPNVLMYKPGTAEGSLSSQDMSLEFYEGIGLKDLFSGSYAVGVNVFSPRVFSGVVRKFYSVQQPYTEVEKWLYCKVVCVNVAAA
ncbi:predicted protein [Thalassiosira pseudonana CCMP1335]|uniref:Peptidase M11 gametolysin domain-containing protein n=1 Tax=Thalassiosira pseudonana TaxID=35128 RepID=B8BWQ2_THAPS|nr:predicted protein [Thalassiosira pseudonana CCMP1335]EED94554.1 predicted protein [Thalassiosira pseudonana CCMP1335]